MKEYSIIQKLRDQEKINETLEVAINSISLEDLIALKLELSSRSVGGKLYGFPLWYSLPDIVKESVLTYALTAAKSKKEAARFLGVNQEYLYRLIKKNNIKKLD